MNFYKMIKSILKCSWKTLSFIREIVLNLLFLLFVISIWIGWSLLTDRGPQSSQKQEGILLFDIQGTIVDHPHYDQDFYLLSNKLYGNVIDLKRENSLFEITRKIQQAASDKNITGIILKLDHFVGADIPSLQYIGKYLKIFKNSNKPIYAVSASYNKAQYYLASFADKIYLPPQGSVNLYGFSVNNLYYKSLLDKLKITPHIFRVGSYKSAIEPFTRDNMSDKVRQNTQRWLNALWCNYADTVASNRHQTINQLFPNASSTILRIRQTHGNMADYARNAHLIDQVKPLYQFEQDVKDRFGSNKKISIYNYLLKEENKKERSEVNVVFVNGTIVDGYNSANKAGNYSVTKQLKLLRKNPNTRAVVIRINSPGGSVSASEDIRSEIEALRKKNIPVVVSMGGMAASGGYWIATASDFIVASKNTITGSIGIFGIIPTFEKSLATLGVHHDGVSTSPLADITLITTLPQDYQQLVQMNIDNGYQTFLKLVADSRGLKLADVDKIAQGQIWLGQEAMTIGLIDKTGDFDDAVAQAAKLAKLQQYQIDWPKRESSWLSTLFTGTFSQLSNLSTVAKTLLGPLPIESLEQQSKIWTNLTDPQYRYSFCLNCADVL